MKDLRARNKAARGFAVTWGGTLLATILALAACNFDPFLSRGGLGSSSASSDDHAEEETGVSYCDGVTDHIYDLDGLKEWGTHSSHSAILYVCIEWDSSESPWTPVGNSTSLYSAIFEGGGHTVSGLVISMEDAASSPVYAGLFGYLSGTVRDLGLENASVVASGGESYVGAIAGYNTGKIDGCWSTGYVTAAGTDNRAGGIAGYNNGGTITDCWSAADVTATGATGSGTNRAGGIAGYTSHSTSAITACWSTGNITATGGASNRAGGIAGYIYEGAITACWSTGNIAVAGSSGSYAGGIAGICYSGSMITACYYSTGKVEGYYAGGILGGVYEGTATACYSTGEVDGQLYAGGITGYDYDDETPDEVVCYYTNAALGVGNRLDTTGVTDKVTGTITWKTAQTAMNEAISNSGISWKYTGASASKAPTLVQD